MDALGHTVEFADAVLEHFARHRQSTMWKAEAGGQLFARIDDKRRWSVMRATGPRKSDFRRRFRFRPNRKAEQAEINSAFAEQLHYVGDWHTHAEPRPQPSLEDLLSMAEMVRESRHDLQGFLMVIAGAEDPPAGLWVSMHLIGGAHRQLVFDITEGGARSNSTRVRDRAPR